MGSVVRRFAWTAFSAAAVLALAWSACSGPAVIRVDLSVDPSLSCDALVAARVFVGPNGQADSRPPVGTTTRCDAPAAGHVGDIAIKRGSDQVVEVVATGTFDDGKGGSFLVTARRIV